MPWTRTFDVDAISKGFAARWVGGASTAPHDGELPSPALHLLFRNDSAMMTNWRRVTHLVARNTDINTPFAEYVSSDTTGVSTPEGAAGYTWRGCLDVRAGEANVV